MTNINYTTTNPMDRDKVLETAVNDLYSGGFIGLNNFKPSNTSTLRRMLADASAGYASSRLFVSGMSTEAGCGALGTGYVANGRSKSWPMQLANLLNKNGYNADAGWIIGGGDRNSSTLPTFDTRITLTNAAEAPAQQSAGGRCILLTASTGVVTFTPGFTFDRVVVMTWGFPGNAFATITVNGGAQTATTGNTPGGGDLNYTTLSCTASTTVTLTAGAGGSGCYVQAIGCYDSTKPGISILNAGWGGSVMTDWSTDVQAGPNAFVKGALGSGQLNATIACHDINDALNSLSLSAYTANLTSWLTYLKTKGDVILKLSPDVGATSVPAANKVSYWDASLNVAKTLDIPWIDLRVVLPDRVDSIAKGISRDDLHNTARGYSIEAQAIYKGLTHLI